MRFYALAHFPFLPDNAVSNSAIPVILFINCKTGHDVVEYVNKEDEDACFCDSHPENKCSAYCKTCDIPICICLSIKHKSQDVPELKDKIESSIDS